MSGTQVNVNDTGYTVYWHYEAGHRSGGYVRCEDCKAAKDFVGLKPLESWVNLHARPGLFGCRRYTT